MKRPHSRRQCGGRLLIRSRTAVKLLRAQRPQAVWLELQGGSKSPNIRLTPAAMKPALSMRSAARPILLASVYAKMEIPARRTDKQHEANFRLPHHTYRAARRRLRRPGASCDGRIEPASVSSGWLGQPAPPDLHEEHRGPAVFRSRADV